ncbi:hypothetical protein Dimus_033790 [Dionaea muscipula]
MEGGNPVTRRIFPSPSRAYAGQFHHSKDEIQIHEVLDLEFPGKHRRCRLITATRRCARAHLCLLVKAEVADW